MQTPNTTSEQTNLITLRWHRRSKNAIEWFQIWVVAVLLLMWCEHSVSEIVITLPENYISDFPGENLIIQNQMLTYINNDVVIPGPNGMDIVVTRMFRQRPAGLTLFGIMPTFGYKWNLEIPFIGTAKQNTTTDNFGCLGDLTSIHFGMPVNRITNVGFASSSQLPTGAIAAFTDGTVFRCSGSVPEYLTADGRIIRFVPYPQSTFPASEYYVVSSIEDRFGNRIDYNYGLHSGYKVLLSITRTDGAQVNFNYTAINLKPYITGITYGNRTISYDYVSLSSFKMIANHYDETGRQTKYTYWGHRELRDIELPTGAKITYYYQTQNPDLGLFGEVRDKTITGTDIEDRYINYNSNNSLVWWDAIDVMATETDLSGSPPKKTTYSVKTVIPGPTKAATGEITMSGRILKIDLRLGGIPQIQDGTLVSRQLFDWDYIVAGGVACKARIDNSTHKSCGRARLQKTTTTLYNQGGADTFVEDPLLFDTYGFVTKTRLTSSDNQVRYTMQTYLHDLSNWLLGLPRVSYLSQTDSNYLQTYQLDYYAPTSIYKSLPQYEYRFGRWLRKFDLYHASGDVRKIIYNGSLRYEQFENYKRGKPQQLTVPNRLAAGAVSSYTTVDDYGNTIWTKDFEGNETSFAYDASNRLTLRDYLNLSWDDETISYDDIQHSQVVASGGRKEWTFWDALGRPKRKMTEDVSQLSSAVYQTTRYDKKGQVSFQSLLSNSPDPTTGITYIYDLLGRKTSETIQSTGTNRRWSYLSGNRVLFTDGRNYPTTTTYRSFGAPEYRTPILTQQPAGVTTAIMRNRFDNITKITQGGISETHIYDIYQQLCKSVRPETGITAFGYNNQRQIIWEARGTTGTATACGGESTSDLMTSVYDNRGDLRSVTLADGSLIQRSTLNGSGDLTRLESDGAVIDYQYNDRHLMTNQALTVDGTLHNLSWSYDRLGNVASITYPDSSTISTPSNALGQQIAAGTLISNATYHPTGGVSSYQMANGINRTMTRHAFGHITKIEDKISTTNTFSHEYTYDLEFNVSNIYDRVQPSYNVTGLSYDGLDRLTGGAGNWGLIGVGYDLVGNITTKRLGASITNYSYNTKNQVSSVSGGLSRLFNYDPRGNVTGNGIRTFSYDKANRMFASDSFTFAYDGQGVRIKKQQGTGVDYFIYGPDGKLMHRQLADGSKKNYIYLDGNLVAEVSTFPVAQTTYTHTDALGSISAKSDVNGSVSARFHYKPFGSAIEPGQNDDPGYTGHLYDNDLGLTYMKARYFDSDIGRFYGVDPVGFVESSPASFNRYVYANNNPYKYVDPDGRASKVATLIRLTADGVKKGARLTLQQAQQARRGGQNVHADTRQIGGQIEKGAFGNSRKSSDFLKHDGHKLTDGTEGMTHFQTKGKLGHTFWGSLSSALSAVVVGLEFAADVAEVVDITTYISSGDRYLDEKGNSVRINEIMNAKTSDILQRDMQSELEIRND